MDSGSDNDFGAVETGAHVRYRASGLKDHSRAPLEGVVRVSRTTTWQIQVRVAEDIVGQLGWTERVKLVRDEAGASIGGVDLCVLVGHGRSAGKLRLVPREHPHAVETSHFATLALIKGGRASAVTLPASVLGISEKFPVFTAPHALGTDSLTIDLSSISIMETKDAD